VLGSLMLMDFCSRLVFAALEMGMVIVAGQRYGWGTAPVSLTLGCCGIAAVALLLCAVPRLAGRHDAHLLLAAFAALLLGCLLQLLTTEAPAFLLSCALWFALGYPLAHTLVAALFSKLVDSSAQGAAQGCLAVAASAGRIVGYMWAPLALEGADFRDSETVHGFFVQLSLVATLCLMLICGSLRAMVAATRAVGSPFSQNATTRRPPA
jgi:hypothetical protein